jgi:hypothetical protein
MNSMEETMLGVLIEQLLRLEWSVIDLRSLCYINHKV